MNDFKKCTTCGEIKLLEKFNICSASKDNHSSLCRICSNKYSREWHKNNKERIKEKVRKYDRERYKNNKEQIKRNSREWHRTHKEEAKKRAKKWYKTHKEQIKRNSREWYKNNKEQSVKKVKEWRDRNPEKVKEIYYRSRIKINSTPKGRLNNNVSGGIRQSLKKGSKNKKHWEELVGYTTKDLMNHLQKKFTKKMSWENYGSYWHVDHKIPISVFNFETPEDIDFKRCWALKNLQPLEATKNLQKHNKLDKHFQPSLLLKI